MLRSYPLHTKICTECSEEKPRAAFIARPAAADGLRSNCRECNRKRVLAHSQSGTGKTVRRQAYRRRTYGLTHAQARRVEAITVCAICAGPAEGSAKHLDHDHATGAVRGVLCQGCNLGLGGFADDPARLAAAIAYLAAPPGVGPQEVRP
jgi:hypothetical protein